MRIDVCIFTNSCRTSLPVCEMTARSRGGGRPSSAAVAHGVLRRRLGYTAPMIVRESRALQVSIFETLQRNLGTVDFSSVLPDIMLIADEVDSQLTQSIDSFLKAEAAEAA